MVYKFLKYVRIVYIDVLVYKISKESIKQLPNLGFDIQTEKHPKGKKKYFIIDNGVSVHSSYLYLKLNILKLIQKEGPAIGDCYTNPNYRGKSIYPFVLNYIAHNIFSEKEFKELFIIVDKNNKSSIKGIEKAGFEKATSIKANRWLLFYFNKNIVTYLNLI